jgi:Icc protein
MTLVAHVTDLHLCEPRPERRSRAERLRLATLNLARPIDPEDRKRRALAALERARDAGAEHVVVTGDLTEDSHPEQFEVLADVLWRCRIPPQRLTLVPGNHDLYTSADAWDRALDGPLGPYASTSRHGARRGDARGAGGGRLDRRAPAVHALGRGHARGHRRAPRGRAA